MSRVLITGANRGIGLALARQLTSRGDEVIGTCRRPADELQVTGARVIENVDVSEPEAIERLAYELGDEPLD
ncbi:MAG: SDR family NAD(P)-dependent oxidoreductase, partial [Xanthomonadales bacterium]|nr:SDR family NAD(P)-dependent oxidoreductase [Xanthomonadales bacterium]